MSTRTTNLQLYKPDLTDPVSPTMFNYNSDILDAQHAVIESMFVADRTRLTALENMTGCRIATGSYVGTSTGQVSLTLGFRPKYFFVMRRTSFLGQWVNYEYNGIFIDSFSYLISLTTRSSISSSDGTRPVTTSNTGISWTLNGCGYENGLNASGITYLYVALG